MESKLSSGAALVHVAGMRHAGLGFASADVMVAGARLFASSAASQLRVVGTQGQLASYGAAEWV